MKTKPPKKPERSNVRGICATCGNNPQGHKGKGLYRAECQACHRRRHEMPFNVIERDRAAYRKSVKDKCEKCGFVPEHMCQLDVDHIDGDKKNNDPSNHQTLCANCHRLKTHINRDWDSYS